MIDMTDNDRKYLIESVTLRSQWVITDANTVLSVIKEIPNYEQNPYLEEIYNALENMILDIEKAEREYDEEE